MQPPRWVESSIIGTPLDNAQRPPLIYVNTYAAPHGLQPSIWHTIDVTRWGIPKDVKAIFLSGILIITHGTTPEIGNLTVALRAPGSQLPSSNYIMQTVAALPGEGERTNGAGLVPCKNGTFELCWECTRPIKGPWPDYCAYGLHLAIQFYVR